MGLDADMLISTLMFSEGDQGRFVVLGVVRPDALDIPPQIGSDIEMKGGHKL